MFRDRDDTSPFICVMDHKTIERLVDGIDTRLGPDAGPEQVEEIAIEMLSDLSFGSVSTSVSSEIPDRITPEEVIVHVSLSDCSSRLASTIVAHGYDKIRRTTSRLPESFRDFFRFADLRVPTITLKVDGVGELLKGFSASNMIDIVTTFEQAAVDVTFDRVQLLSLRAGKNDTASFLLPHLSDLLAACSKAELDIEIGSKTVGLRAQDLLDVGRAFVHSYGHEDEKSFLTVSCNTSTEPNPFALLKGDLRVDISVSIWPRLDEAAVDIGNGACYTDRYEILGQVGLEVATSGRSMLEQLIHLESEIRTEDSLGSVSLSLNTPDEGPLRAGIWAGFPVEVDSSGGAGSAAAVLLRNGLLSKMSPISGVRVISDGLPLSNSLRNVAGISSTLPAAELAGFLVEVFTEPLESGMAKKLRLVRPGSSKGSDRSILQPSGPIDRIERITGWTDEHFTRGGALIPPLK